jgi:transcriptional regulator with XRE-family HTH domain
MKLDSMTDHAIAQEIGKRIAQMRLQQNLTQQYVADEIGLSRVSYSKLEQGAAKFENIIAVLRVLGRLDLVGGFVPEVTPRPMQQLKMKGKRRRRASTRQGKRVPTTTEQDDDKDQELDW